MARYPISGVFIADQRALESDLPVQHPHAWASDSGWMEGIAIMTALFDELILVAADPFELLAWDALIVSDHFAPPGLLSGIQAGLFAARHTHIFIAAAGTGPVSPAVIDLFGKALEPRWDGVLAESENGVLPLPGIYGKRALKPLTRQLECGDLRFDRFLPQIRTRKLAAQAIHAVDPGWNPSG